MGQAVPFVLGRHVHHQVAQTVATPTNLVVTPSTGVAWLCPANANGIGPNSTITLLTNLHYNLQVNNDFKSCAFGTIP